MAIVNVACPYCGKEANATIPRDAKLYDVKKKKAALTAWEPPLPVVRIAVKVLRVPTREIDMYTPDLDTLPKHELQRQVGQMREYELGQALTLPEAYSAGPREQRTIQKELGWREQERMAAAQAHDDALRQAGFETGFDVDITQGIPDPIADPLPDQVVNHVDNVVDGRFQPFEIPDPPAEVVTPSKSSIDEVPFVSHDAAQPKSIDENRDEISVKFSVSFDDSFDDKFSSKFTTR